MRVRAGRAKVIRVRMPLLVLKSLREQRREALALELADGAGLAALSPEATEVEMPLEAYVAFSDNAARKMGDPFLGLHVAMAVSKGRYGLFEYIMRSRATVREAIVVLARFAPLVYPQIEVAVERGASGAQIEYRVPGAPEGVGRHGNEFAVASILKIGREASGIDLVPARIEFGHERPRDISELERFFGTDRISFSSRANRIHVSAETLDAPFRSADPALFNVLEIEAKRHLPASALGSQEPMPGLRERMRQRMRDGEPLTLDAVAEAMRSSSRTVQRRLGDDGTSFQGELDLVRCEIATEELRNGKLSIYEIALLTGYANQSAFERAFQRWTGTTPRRYQLEAR